MLAEVDARRAHGMRELDVVVDDQRNVVPRAQRLQRARLVQAAAGIASLVAVLQQRGAAFERGCAGALQVGARAVGDRVEAADGGSGAGHAAVPMP